ncbi:unnamed protein product, partial [Darwinula stevensoni]
MSKYLEIRRYRFDRSGIIFLAGLHEDTKAVAPKNNHILTAIQVSVALQYFAKGSFQTVLSDCVGISQQMREFFEICGPHGLNSVNAVGFVLPSSAVRLTAAQKYIFHAITQLFAIDTKEKFVLLCSFCDGQEPAAIIVVRNAKLHYQDYHTFNNSAMFACSRDPMQKMFWDLGHKNNKAFLESLDKMAPVCLAMTKKVLHDRRTLTETLKKLQEQIPRAASNISVLQERCRQLTEMREQVAKVVDVAEERAKTHLEQERAMNCNDCKKTTCEYPATHLKQKDIKYSKCMIRNEHKKMICRKCGCSWRSHCLEAKRYEGKSVYRHKGQDNSVEVAQRVQGIVTLEKGVKALTTDIKKNQVELFARIQQAHKITVRLKEIALNPNPLTMEEYIEFLIEAEKKDEQDGFKKRIEHLEQAKRASILCRKILNENGSAEAIMPDVMTILEKENIDFETLDAVETPVATIDQPTSNLNEEGGLLLLIDREVRPVAANNAAGLLGDTPLHIFPHLVVPIQVLPQGYCGAGTEEVVNRFGWSMTASAADVVPAFNSPFLKPVTADVRVDRWFIHDLGMLAVKRFLLPSCFSLSLICRLHIHRVPVVMEMECVSEAGGISLDGRKKATWDGGKMNCKYVMHVFGSGYDGKMMQVCPKHKHDLLSQLYHDLHIPENVPFHMEVYDEKWKRYVDVDWTRLPDVATLRLRFGGSEKAVDTEKEKKNDEAEDEEEETGDEEGRSQSSSNSWSTAPNAAKSKKIPRAIRTGRENAPRPRIRKEIPQRPLINKEFPHIPRIEKRQARPFRETTLAEEMKGLAKLIQSGVDGKPTIYELWKSVVVENKEMGIAKFDIGPRLRKQDERVLMVVGKTGAGIAKL